MPDDLAFVDATGQAELVSSGQALPRELVDAAIGRVEKLNGELNAVVTQLFEKARVAAEGALPQGPLRGVPFLLKDLWALSEGDPYAEGVKAARAAGRADHDSVITERFRAAGLVCVGRTNTPELGLVPTTEGEAYGPCRNPGILAVRPAGPVAVRLRRWPPGWSRSPTPATGAARSAFRPACAVWSGSSPAGVGCRCGPRWPRGGVGWPWRGW